MEIQTNILMDAIDTVARKMGIAINWTETDILPYLQDLCTRYAEYKIALNALGIFFGLSGIIISIVLAKITFRIHKKIIKIRQEWTGSRAEIDDIDFMDTVKNLCETIALTIIVFAVPTLFYNIYALLHAVYTPELLLAKEILRLL